MNHQDSYAHRFDAYIREIAEATTERGCVASQLDTLRLLPPVDEWGFPKYPDRTVILPPDADLVVGLRRFVAANETLLREPDCCLGTWIDPGTLHCYLDITTSRANLADARRAAEDAGEKNGRKIVALYNSKRGELVYLRDDVCG